MFKTISKYAERKGFGFRDGFVAIGAVRKDSWEIRDFADPAAIVFSFDLNGEITHACIVQLRSRIEKFAVQRPCGSPARTARDEAKLLEHSKSAVRVRCKRELDDGCAKTDSTTIMTSDATRSTTSGP